LAKAEATVGSNASRIMSHITELPKLVGSDEAGLLSAGVS